jgi:hypothetical protein
MRSGSENILKTHEAAETFIEAEQIRRENLGRRATHIDGALAEDALRALDILKTTPCTLLDAARFVGHAHFKLEPHAVRIDDAINAHALAIERRNRSVTVNKLVDEFIENRRAKGKSEIYIRDLTTRLRRFKSSMGDRITADITSGEVDQWIQSLNVAPQTQNNFRAVLSAMWDVRGSPGSCGDKCNSAGRQRLLSATTSQHFRLSSLPDCFRLSLLSICPHW